MQRVSFCSGRSLALKMVLRLSRMHANSGPIVFKILPMRQNHLSVIVSTLGERLILRGGKGRVVGV